MDHFISRRCFLHHPFYPNLNTFTWIQNKSLDGFGMLKDTLVKVHHNTFLSFMVNVIEHQHIQITIYAEGTEIFYEQPFSIFMSKGRNKILYFVTTSYQTLRRFIHSSHELDTSISICLLWWMFCFM